MTVSNTITINEEQVDITNPCEVLSALLKAEILLEAGGQAVTIRVRDEEVTYRQNSSSGLQKLISKYQRLCEKKNGRRSQYAARIRHF